MTSTVEDRDIVWKVHWLGVSVWGMEAEQVAEEVSEVVLGRRMGLEGWASRGGARFYRRRRELVRGVSLLSEPVAQDAGDHVHVVLPGQACEVMGGAALLGLLAWARDRAERVQVTRLDLAVDGCPFSPRDVLDAVCRGQVVSRASRGPDGLIRHKLVESNEESTLYVGSRGSERRLRIYDRRGHTRTKLECTDETADRVAWLLVGQRGAGDAVLAKTVIGVIRGYLDFGERRDRKHGVRGLRLLPWWQAFVGEAERMSWAVGVSCSAEGDGRSHA